MSRKRVSWRDKLKRNSKSLPPTPTTPTTPMAPTTLATPVTPTSPVNSSSPTRSTSSITPTRSTIKLKLSFSPQQSVRSDRFSPQLFLFLLLPPPPPPPPCTSDAVSFDSRMSGQSSLKPSRMSFLSQDSVRVVEPQRYDYANCCFCEDSLTITLPGEVVLHLLCDHICHKNCYALVLDKYDQEKRPICGQCKIHTKCREEEVHRAIVEQYLSCHDDVPDIEEEPDEELEEELDEALVDRKGKGKVEIEMETEMEIEAGEMAEMDGGQEKKTTDKPQINAKRVKCGGNHLRTSSIMSYENESDNAENEVFSPAGPLPSNDPIGSPPLLVSFPPLIAEGYEEYVYRPSITFSSETAEVRVGGELDEISYILNIKPPPIYNESSLMSNLQDYQIQANVNSYIKRQLQLDFDLGDLVIFDNMQISVDGMNWDDSKIYLFSNYLLLYNDKTLEGMISIADDLCSVTFYHGILNLNLADGALPELNIRNKLTDALTEKWAFYLNQVRNQQNPEVSLFQFTSTCWLELQDEFEIPSNLARFCKLLLHGGELLSTYIAKILPPPKPLPLNLIFACPLYNATESITNKEYTKWLQDVLKTALESLRPQYDYLTVIFLGVDADRLAAKDSLFVCAPCQWDGWEEFIDEIEVVLKNSFHSIAEELNAALGKCQAILSFLPNKSSSINKLLFLGLGASTTRGKKLNEKETQEGKENKISAPSLINYTELLDTLSVTVLKVGSHDPALNEALDKLPLKFGGVQLIRFATALKLLASLVTIIREHIQRICIPRLSIQLRASEGVYVSSIESHGLMTNLQEKEYTIQAIDILPNSEINTMVKFKLGHIGLHYHDTGTVSVFHYAVKWLFSSSLEKTVYSKVQMMNKMTTTTMMVPSPSTTKLMGSAEDIIGNPFIDCTDTSSVLSRIKDPSYMDIPLMPPLSPIRGSLFAKRQVELLVVKKLKKAVALNDETILDDCISLIHKESCGNSTGFLAADYNDNDDDNNDDKEEERENVNLKVKNGANDKHESLELISRASESDDKAYSSIELLTEIKYASNGLETYVEFLISQIRLIIRKLHASVGDVETESVGASSEALDYCQDLIYALI
ncbi:hypothetical protein LELG_05438 [Lodderomyces elongisporus NRRL YB-4239]|uniref:Uncharacterized protein n=1 Tax=Lodderomyces elongisporus (strain ATCC 11503 / CBS 2605 / JCM 1781 / NBRC 1676 / NRRL YB-4239) TaxID=379508 RepID=A5E749_LODEL|nr:hypothetical protein LELG_05438 [Lodderomyces elongisporus NRRL YB-4239]